ncbi:50S ribosomal protein L15 [Pseudahrensia aquimaris]|uniref:Large ribosomal subunit protein uL15 n=1 Tax=Pseudahrensia aquimaris TaxID=744461 RepID=A0ABW3FJ95_9HYPH
MKLNELSEIDGASPSRKRVGRGIGSGKGKTGGRGVKGQKSRSGVAIKGFEGGQMPIYRRLPKRGFSNAKFAKNFNTVSLGRLQTAVDAGKLDAKATVDSAALIAAGVLRRAKDGFRVLADGDLKAKLNVTAAGISKAAQEKLEKAGGSFTQENLGSEKAAEVNASKAAKTAAKKKAK